MLTDAAAALWVAPGDGHRYPVLAGNEEAAVVAQLASAHRRVVLLADDNTAVYARAIAARLPQNRLLQLRVRAGDRYKSRAEKARLEDTMLAAGIDRQALLIAVGGGVVCDLGGFVAGSYMRGIAHINVATTLLCQVDAAIGGKTAVNTPLAKNAIGMFHHPRAVVLHHRALATLPDEELRCGFAEAIKQAALAPDDLFEVLAGWLAAPTGRLPPPALVLRCAAVKAEVVAADSRDEGVRQLLNFGHTVGHGLERASDYALRHGAAVSIGMHMEARAAVLRGTFPAHDLETLLAALEAAALPTVANRPFEAVWRFMQRDKKNQDGAVMMAVPRRLGSREPVSGGYTQALDEAVLREVWC